MTVIFNRRAAGAMYDPVDKAFMPDTAGIVARADAATRGWYVPNMRGLGEGSGVLSSIPSWVLWGAGGLAAGALVGYLVLRKKK